MSTEIKTIGPTATVAEARAVMRTNGIHHLLVRSGRRVVGVVSDGDLGGRIGSRNTESATLSVTDVMTAPVVTAAPETTIRQAANLLRGRGVGCLAVLEGDKPVGIVTTTDLLELIGRGVDRPILHTTRWTLPGRGVRGAGPSARHARRA